MRGYPIQRKPKGVPDIMTAMDISPGAQNVKEQCGRALAEVGASQEFCEFFSDVLQYEYEMNHSIYRLGHSLQQEQQDGDPVDPAVLYNTTKDLTKNFNRWKDEVKAIAERGMNIPPLKLNPKMLAKSRVLKALCSIQTKEVNVQEGDEMTITDTSKPNKLKVRTAKGQEGYLPALTCILPTPDKSALTASERLQIQLLAAWTECVRKIRTILMDTLLLYTYKLSDEWKERTNNNIAPLARDRVSRRFRRIIDAANKPDPRSDLTKLHDTLYSVERELTSWNDNGADLNGMIDTVANLDKAVLCYQNYHQQWLQFRTGLKDMGRPIQVVDSWKQLRAIAHGKSFKYYEMKVTLETVQTKEEVTYIENPNGGSSSGGSDSVRQKVSSDQLTSTSGETRVKIVINSVIDPRSGLEIPFQEAIDSGIINQNTGMYVNPRTRESIPIPIAMNEGKIKVEHITTKKMEEKTTAVGLLTITTKKENISYKILGAIDPSTGEKVDLEEAESRGLLDDGKTSFIMITTGETIPIEDAIEIGWVQVQYDTESGEPEYETKTFAVHSVVDQRLKKKVPFHDAVQAGLIDKDTGTYINNVTNEKIFVAEAIKKGFLKGKEVADPNSMKIDSSNRVVVKRMDSLREKFMKPMEAISALRNAANKKLTPQNSVE